MRKALTDNGSCHRSHAFKDALGDIKHRQTRPYRPRANGKVERFHRALADGWAYARLYRSDAERCAEFPWAARPQLPPRPHRTRRPTTCHPPYLTSQISTASRQPFGVRKVWHTRKHAGHDVGRDQVRLLRPCGISKQCAASGARSPPSLIRARPGLRT